MPQLDFDGANSKISADKIQGQSGTTVTIPAGHNLAGDGSGLTSLSAANITSGGTLPALNGSALTNLPSSTFRTGIHVWKNAGQTVANGTVTKVTYTEEFYDPNNDWDVSTSKFTVPEDGKYLITAGVRFSSGTQGYMTHLYFYINGAMKTYSDNVSGNGTGINTTHTHISELSTSDEIEIYGIHNQGSSMIFEADASAGFKFNYLAIQRIA